MAIKGVSLKNKPILGRPTKVDLNWRQQTLKNGVWHGFGEMVYQNKDIYCGNFANGLRESHGLYTWSNGNTYEGQWKNDEMHDGIVNNKKQGLNERCVWTAPSQEPSQEPIQSL